MTESKMRRLVSAGTVMAEILFVVLIAFLVYQLVVMGAKKSKIEKLQTEITELQEEKKNLENEIDLWQQEWKIEERARQIKNSN